VAITIGYAFLIYKFTGILVWTSVIASGVGILLLAFLVQRWSRKNKGKKKTPEEDKTAKRLKIASIVLYCLGIVFFIALCCLWKNLAIAIAVLKTAAVIVMRNIRMLLMPFASSLVILLWTATWLVFFILLVSCGKIT
jgi:MFS family permease